MIISVPKHLHQTCICIGKHKLTFILMFHTLLDRVCGLSKHRFPYLRVDRHQRGYEADFALGRFRCALGSPGQQFEDTDTYTVPKDVQST